MAIGGPNFTTTGWKFDNGVGQGGDKLKLTVIENWGNLNISTNDAFWGCSNLNVTADNAPIVSATDMDRTFSDCTALTSIGGDWDVSNITQMKYFFNACTNFNQDIGDWTTTSLVNIQSMFHGGTNFNQDISSWDTSNIIGMASTFQAATAFNQNLNGWDWSKNIDSWGMFNTASSFNNGGVAPNWDMSKCEYFVQMFQYTNFNHDMSGCAGIGAATTGTGIWYQNMFAYNTTFDQNIGHFLVNNIKDSAWWGMTNILIGGGLSTENYNATLIAWAAQDASDNHTPHFGDSVSTGAGATAKASLISEDSWIITDNV